MLSKNLQLQVNSVEALQAWSSPGTHPSSRLIAFSLQLPFITHPPNEPITRRNNHVTPSQLLSCQARQTENYNRMSSPQEAWLRRTRAQNLELISASHIPLGRRDWQLQVVLRTSQTTGWRRRFPIIWQLRCPPPSNTWAGSFALFCSVVSGETLGLWEGSSGPGWWCFEVDQYGLEINLMK